MNVRGALASFAAAGTLSLLASQAVADSPPTETSAPPPKPALAPTAQPAAEQAPLPQPAPSPTSEPPPPEAKPNPQPAIDPAPLPEPEAKPAPEPATEPASPPKLEPAPDAARDAKAAAEPDGTARPDAAPTVEPPMTAVDGADTERSQGRDGFPRALAPPPNLAPLDGGRGLDLSGLDLSSGEQQRLRPLEQLNLPVEQLQGLPLQRQAPGPGGEPPLPPPPCVLTNAGLVCTGAQNCVLTSGGAICIQGGIPCVVTSAGSQCVPGCALTSAGLVCPSGCTLTSAGIRCPVAGRVLGSASERLEPSRRRKVKRTRAAPVEEAPRFEAAVVPPRERGSRRGELPFTGAPVLMQVAVACLLLAAGVLLARRTRARAR